MHVDLVVRKEWIEREKVEFLFNKGREEGNKGERRKGKRENQSVGAKFSPKSLLWLKCGKEKRENQSVGVALIVATASGCSHQTSADNLIYDLSKISLNGLQIYM